MARIRYKLILCQIVIAFAIFILVNFCLIPKKISVSIGLQHSDPRLLPLRILRSPPIDYCRNLDMLVVVHTRLNSQPRRDFWRRTYGSSFFSRNFKYKLLFSLGMSPDETKRQDNEIQRESDIHEDILQSDYMDTYKNLTIKQLSQLRYFYENCSDHTVMMKIDDDIAWDIEQVHEEALKVRVQSDMEIRCALWSTMHVERNNKSKWYVSEEEFSLKFYPGYCSGMAYLLQHKAAGEMIKVAPHLRFFWVDDVFITGMITAAAGVKIKDMMQKYTLRPNLVNVTEMFALTGRATSEAYFSKMNSRLLATEKKLENNGN